MKGSFFSRYALDLADPALILSCAWICGCGFGLLAVFSGDAAFLCLVRGVPTGSASFAGLLCTLLLPLLLSAWASFLSKPWLLVPIAFAKAFLFSYTFSGICLAYGRSGWLVCILTMFSDLSLLPLLWRYWLRCFRSGGSGRCFCITAAAILILGYLDFSLVSPFGVNLLSSIS